LYVAEETAGEVSRIEANGAATPVASGLASPEGIAFDDAGNLYVVEDVQAGRLLKIAPGGATTTLASGFDAPEGVVWTPGGSLYVTESNVQFGTFPPDLPQTRITAVSPTGVKTPVLTHTPSTWSYAGITLGTDGLLYVTNDASAMTNPGTHDGVFSVNPVTQERKLLALNLRAPEGLRFGAGGGFPLYVAQEDTWDEPPANGDNYKGVVSRVEANGSQMPFCTGFQSVEDVIQDGQGRIYVSEDSSGLVIAIEPEPPQRTQAGAVILLIGDGMGEAQRRAGRWSAVGRSGSLSMDRMPTAGWSRTASADSPVTDSAAAATALASGVKTDNGRIGQDPAGNSLTSILERAQARGMAVGLVTTVQMAHATPAAFAAHVPDRNMMTEIARQMLAAEVDVLLGGGEDEFLPAGVNGCYAQPGERTDGRNLIAEAQAAGYTYVCNAADFATVATSTTRLLGLFADEEMAYPFSPPLADMTQKAIGILSQDPDGFFLMVEGGQIDWAGHANDAARVISDTLGFDQAVSAARAYAASAGNTLIVVTGDHETGGMSAALTLSGSPDGPFSMPDETPFYVNWTTTDHTAADVPTTAQGPWADWLAATHENTFIHDVMCTALEGAPDIYLPVVVKASRGL
jgi:alkaline phosphatase